MTRSPIFQTRILRFAGTALLIAFLSACSSVPRLVHEYRIDIQQGNVLTQEMVAQLKPGMTKDQVRFVLGTPVLMDMFHGNRWDYVYRYQKGSTGEVEMRKFSTFFDADSKLTRVTGDVTAADASDLAAEPDTKSREIDLGTIGDDAVAPPPSSGKGFFGRMMESVGF
jgi:outer membrane protein assembly factor BamE